MKFTTFLTLVFLCLTATLPAQEVIKETHGNVKTVRINLAAADIMVEKSSSASVTLQGEYDSKNSNVKIENKDGILTIQQAAKAGAGDNLTNNVSGNSKGMTWKLGLPEGAELLLKIGAGDITVNGTSGSLRANVGAGNFKLSQVKGDIQLNTGSGNIEVTKGEGDYKLNTGTGNVLLTEVSGSLSANSGTGNVAANDAAITGQSSLNSGTGKVALHLAAAPQANLSVNSGTADARLDLNGHAFTGTLTMYCDKEKGKIEAPFAFDQESTEKNGDQETISKTKQFGKVADEAEGEAEGEASIQIQIGTGTGVAVVEE